MTPEKQEILYPELSNTIGWKSIQRRNIGFVYAYQNGADIVATVDDDNIPDERIVIDREGKEFVEEPITSDADAYIDHIISELDILIKENNYEHIFLVTMIDIFYAKVLEKFKEKVIVVEDKRYTSVDKDWGDKDWDHGSNSYLQESLDSYTEVYIASQCKFVIGGASNMLLGCLFMNPNINFKLFDCLHFITNLITILTFDFFLHSNVFFIICLH